MMMMANTTNLKHDNNNNDDGDKWVMVNRVMMMAPVPLNQSKSTPPQTCESFEQLNLLKNYSIFRCFSDVV